MANRYPHPFRKLAEAFRRYNARLPMKISQKAVLEIKENFSKGGYRGESGFVKWKARKQKSKKDQGRALLIKTGRLRRSIRAMPEPGVARVVTDVPYARALNDGVNQTVSVRGHMRKGRPVKAHSRRVDMPARPFMTVGPQFVAEMERMIVKDLEEMFINANR